MVEDSLICLRKVMCGIQLQSHPNFRESILTWVMQNLMNENSYVLLLSHIKQSNLHDTLSTLEFSQKCISRINRPKIRNYTSKMSPQHIERIEKLEEEVLDLKRKIMKSKFNHDMKAKNLAKLIGIPENLIINDKTNEEATKKVLIDHRESVEKYDFIEKRNFMLTEKINSLAKNFKEFEKKNQKLTESYEDKEKFLAEKIEKFKSEIEAIGNGKMNYDKLQKAVKTQDSLIHSHQDILENVAGLALIPSSMKSRGYDVNSLIEIKEFEKLEKKSELNAIFLQGETEQIEIMNSMKEKYEKKINELEKDTQGFMIDIRNYMKTKE